MDIIRPAEGPIIEVCKRLSLFLTPKGPSVSQGSRTVERARRSYVLLGLFWASEAIWCKPSPPAALCKALWGSVFRRHSDTCCHAYISASHIHTQFAGELPLHRPAGPMHRTEIRDILVVDSVTK